MIIVDKYLKICLTIFSVNGGVFLKKITAVLVSGHIGSAKEAELLKRRWSETEQLYQLSGFGFEVAPRCDDEDGVSRKSLWAYRETLADYLESLAGEKIVLMPFSAGKPIADMALERLRAKNESCPEILAEFCIEGTKKGISFQLAQKMQLGESEFVWNLEPSSQFMIEASKIKPMDVPRVDVCGQTSDQYPNVFGPWVGTHQIHLPDICHSKLEYSIFTHMPLIARILDLQRLTPRKS